MYHYPRDFKPNGQDPSFKPHTRGLKEKVLRQVEYEGIYRHRNPLRFAERYDEIYKDELERSRITYNRFMAALDCKNY